MLGWKEKCGKSSTRKSSKIRNRKRQGLRAFGGGRSLQVEHLEERRLLATDLPLGPEFLVNTTTQDNQFQPAVAADTDNGFVVAWSSVGQDGDGHGVFGRRFGEDGAALGSEFPVNATTVGDQLFPDVAIDADGGSMVVWESTAGYGQGTRIVGRHFDPNGVPAGGEFVVSPTDQNDHFAPSITMAADGGFVVVWDRLGSTGDAVMARLHDASGSPRGDAFQVNTTEAAGLFFPAVDGAPDGSFVVAWESRLNAGGTGILAQPFDSSGNVLGGEIRVDSQVPGDQFFPSVAVNNVGDFVVVWENVDGTDSAVLGQRFAATGTARGSAFQVNEASTAGRFRPNVAGDPSGRFVVVWDSFGPDGDRDGSFGRRFDQAGVASTDEFQVNTTTADDQEAPSVGIFTTARQYVIVWESQGSDGDGLGIHGQRFGIDEVMPDSGILSGFVYADGDNDGIKDPGEAGIAGVRVLLTGVDGEGGQVNQTAETDSNGFYEFTLLATGIYAISEEQPAGWLDGRDTIGTSGGVTSNDRHVDIVLPASFSGENNNFGELSPLSLSSLSGVVYVDVNNDGVRSASEQGLAGVSIAISGIDDLERQVSASATTDADGQYRFVDVRPGSYTITETQPTDYNNGKDTPGSIWPGTVANDRFADIPLPAGVDATGYNFGERGLKASAINKTFLFGSTLPADEPSDDAAASTAASVVSVGGGDADALVQIPAPLLTDASYFSALVLDRTILYPVTPQIDEEPVDTEYLCGRYDIDGSGKVDLGDMAFFAASFMCKVDETAESPARASDFDGSGRVDMGDLAHLAANFQRNASDPVLMARPWDPACMENGSLPEISANIDNVALAAIAGGASPTLARRLESTVKEAISGFRRRAPTVDVAALADATIEIMDLPGDLLGLVTSDKKIRLDVNAAGQGWFVDASLRDTPANRVDILTAVMHEFGHLLGLEHNSQDLGVMTEALSAGTRHLLTQMAFES